MLSTIKGIRIDAVAVGVPNKWVSLEEQFGFEGSGIDEKTLRKFIKNTGVEGRYISIEKQTNSDLCYAAAEKILAEKEIDRNEIGVLIYISQTVDYRQPATSLVLQYRLNVGVDCIAFDINLGCSGYVYGLNVIGSLMMQCNAKYGLLMCGETGTRDIICGKESSDNEDILFGDAGSATLLVKDTDSPDMNFMSMSDGSRFKALIHPWGFYRNPVKVKDVEYMDGIAVFNFSTEEAPDLINALMKELKTTSDDYDYLVLHQANKLIMKQIAKKTGFSEEKSLKSIDVFGNTSSASIPTALVKNLADSNKGKSRFLLSGYGIGLSWSVVDCYIAEKDIFQLVRTDEYFEDGYQL
ncbi:MAG: ketoacyl-ACP synthase III [Saccharofermentans sp.]|nr:ketoacyl-ACP synthase III [Saccharofermentans sp.]